jgi:hypothetical protein
MFTGSAGVGAPRNEADTAASPTTGTVRPARKRRPVTSCARAWSERTARPPVTSPRTGAGVCYAPRRAGLLACNHVLVRHRSIAGLTNATPATHARSERIDR